MGIENADCARMLQTTIVLFTGNSRKIRRRSITKIDVDVEHSLLAFPGGSCTELTWSSGAHKLDSSDLWEARTFC